MRVRHLVLGAALGCAASFGAASAGDLTTLYAFTGGADGAYPQYGLIKDGSQILYGTTRGGDTAKSYGTVFSLTQDGTKKTLYAFKGGTDGAYPSTHLITDGLGGALIGTTEGGDKPHDYGTLFRLANDRHGWRELIVHRFTGGSDGGHPRSGVFQDPGIYALYGTTAGGTTKTDFGSIYSFIPFDNNHKHWLPGNHYNFTGEDGNAAYPEGTLRNGEGNLFGIAPAGGDASAHCKYQGIKGCGAIFAWSLRDSSVTFPVLPKGPPSPSVFSGDLLLFGGNVIYGTSAAGSRHCDLGTSCGTIFSYDVQNDPAPVVVHEFKGTDGGGATRGMIFGSDDGASMYGTTEAGGTGICMENGVNVGCGVIYLLEIINGTHYRYTVLYNFQGGADGFQPQDILYGYDGFLYGETKAGGTGGFGTVFKLSLD